MAERAHEALRDALDGLARSSAVSVQAEARVETQLALRLRYREICAWLGDVVDAGMCLLDREQGGSGGRIDMQRWRLSAIGAGAWPVEMPVAQDHALEWRRRQRQALERDDTGYGDRTRTLRVDIERVGFRVRLRAWRIDPCDALHDQSARPRCERRPYEVLGALTANASIARPCFSHPARIEAGREIGQLMYDKIRSCCRNCARQGRRIEYIDDHCLDTGRAQRIALGARSGHADDVMPCLAEERQQPRADGTGRPGQEYPHGAALASLRAASSSRRRLLPWAPRRSRAVSPARSRLHCARPGAPRPEAPTRPRRRETPAQAHH